MAEPHVNQSMLEHASRVVARMLEAARRGDEHAQRALLRYAAADAMESALTRLAALADRCAPSLDEVKITPSSFGSDAVQLRFEVEHVASVLNQAAGRAVVVQLAGAQIGLGAIRPEHPDADHSHDSGEFPPTPSPSSFGGAA